MMRDWRTPSRRGYLAIFMVMALSALAAMACENPTAPSDVSGLKIAPAADGLLIGQSLALSAVWTGTGGTQAAVLAQWSSTEPSVAVVDQNGVVTGIALGTATITATYNNNVASQPISVVPSFAGRWKGKYVIEDCTLISGSGSNYCRFSLGVSFPFELWLQQQGKSLVGSIDLYNSGGTQVTTSGSVEGSTDPSGAFRLAGTVRSVVSEQPETTTLTEWRTALTSDGKAIAGRFVKNREFRNAFGTQNSREDCSIPSAELVP